MSDKTNDGGDFPEEEEYKQQANSLKEQGNSEFQAGRIENAVKLFSQSIDLDPDNYIVYSNRSAAYMKLDSISKALKDAEKCVELAPHWSKGYNRLGIAQQSLKRFDAAIDTFKKGIELDPNNQTLWSALQLCKEIYEAEKQQRFKAAEAERHAEEMRQKRLSEMKAEMMKEKAAAEEKDLVEGFLSEVANDSKPTSSIPEDDLLSSFFTEVAQPAPLPGNQSASNEKLQVSLETDNLEKKDEKLMTEKYTNQDLDDGKAQCNRLLCEFHEWKNLNPFYVFLLDIDATEEDIKFRYKALSRKVHPDRLRDVENAREAFEVVKDAYNKLMDPDIRKNTILHIELVTTETRKERRRQINKGIKEEDLLDFEEQRQKDIMKHFAEMEQMRRRSERNLRAYSAREKTQAAEEEEKNTRFSEFDESWREENRQDKRVGNWRDFQHDPLAKKAKASNFKEQTRDDGKHGVVKLEEWKKSWK